MNNIETMKLALEALETNNKAWKSLADSGDAGWWEAEEQPFYEISFKAITSLRQAIEQAQQVEPVAYIRVSKTGHVMACAKTGDFFSLPHKTLLYTTPPPRQWVGLTDEDDLDWEEGGNLKDLVKAIEAKLKEKNT